MGNEIKLYRCRCYLFCLYELLEKFSSQIAEECGVGTTTILRWLRKFNIKIKTKSEIRKVRMDNEIKLYRCRCYLFCLYELLEKSSPQIAEECGVGTTTILRWLRKFNIKIKTKSEIKIGKKNPFYNKHHSDKTKKILSEKKKGKFAGNKHPMYGRTGDKAPMYGRTGENHPSYKGDDVKNLTYETIHRRIGKIKPKPEDGKCKICNKIADKTGITKLELSNIKDHHYTLNPDDYQYTHHSCHISCDAKKRKVSF